MKHILEVFFFSISLFGQSFPGGELGVYPGGVGGGSSGMVASTGRLFNGSSDLLSNSTDYLSGANTFTIAFWFESGDDTQTGANIWTTNFGAFNTGVIYGYTSSGGKAEVEFLAEGFGGTDPRPGTRIVISDTDWHHIVYRYDGTVWCFFLDGVKTVINSSITFSLTSMSARQSKWMVGTNGALARFYISTSALTDGQIAALASPCSSAGDLGTAGYWLMLGNASPEPESSPSPNTNYLIVTGTTQTGGPICSGQ